MNTGFIGLGNVGAKLAGSLLRNGYDLLVHDVDFDAGRALVDRGAVWVDSGKQMAETCDVVITCLPSPAVSAQVMEEAGGVLEGMAPGKIWLEMSSTDADEVRRIGARVEEQGAFALDCPVSGGCHRAATGNIAIFAGGRRDAFEKVLPLLTTIGRNVLHTGELGSASILKVATNFLAGVQLISTGEAFMVAKKAGIDLGVAYEAIRISSGNSFVHETEGQLILNGSYNINFTMDHEVKDLTLFDDLGKKYDLPLEMSPLAVQIMRDGLARYGPRAWSSMVVKRLEDACNEDLRAPGFPEYLTDEEPEGAGSEVKPRQAERQGV
ncbi:MAG: NAD(P)-dependent oxidoreductase [Gammaproteobacteria bacterium]|nr:NAD(P)-dependent oxidoreductase [Gammaproteobacteria bacterium]